MMGPRPRERLERVRDDLAGVRARLGKLATVHRTLKERLRRRRISSFQRYQLATRTTEEFGVSILVACELTGLSRSSYYHHRAAAMEELDGEEPNG